MFTRHCLAYGVHFALRAPDGPALGALLRVLPHGTTIADAGPVDTPTFSLLRHPDDPQFAALLEQAERQIFLHVGIHAPDVIFLHAGVVGWRGRAMLFPGSTCAGKTTLVAELVNRGALYYSDDYALLDSAGLVHPYARDPRVRQPSTREHKAVPLHELTGQVGTAPIPIAQVVFTHFVPGAEWNPQPLTPGLAILELLRHALPAQHRPAQVLATLKAVMLTAQARSSPRGEAALTAERLLNAIDSGPSTQ